MQVQILPAAPVSLPGSVKVARRPVKPFGVGASPTLAANFGRQADISWLHLSRKQDPLSAETGALPVPSANSTINPITFMTINLLLPKWLARRFARPRARRATPAELKQRQLLPTLPEQKRLDRFQDDDSPPGYRIQWRL